MSTATNCTWEGCTQTAKHESRSTTGEKWADLCDEHEHQLSASLTSGGPGSILSSWIKAQGGAKAAAARMTGSKP